MARRPPKTTPKPKPEATPSQPASSNQASQPAAASSKSKAAKSGPNTPTRPYIDKFNTAPECKENKERIAKACKPDPERTEAEKEKGPPKKKGVMATVSKASHALDKLGRVGYKRNDANAWVDSHCDFMWIKPMDLGKQGEEFNKAVTAGLEKLQSDKWNLARHALDDLGKKAIEKAGDAAKKKLTALAARTVAKHAVGLTAVGATLGTVGDAVEVGMIAWTVTDVISTATELAAMAGEEGLLLLENVKDSLNIKEKVDGILEDFKKHPNKALADSMEFAGKLNKCLRAKRCQLVPMAQTSARKAKDSGQGCCPGQTGHHLLPKEMFKRKIEVADHSKPKKKDGKPATKMVDDPTNCPAYTDAVHDNAPVVCVEGTNQYTASHGTIHEKIDGLMTKHRSATGKDSITNEEAMDFAVKSHQETFKVGCNTACLKEQLKSYYEKLCDGQMKPRGGTGRDTDEMEDVKIEVPAL